jgi:hypothetical protein
MPFVPPTFDAMMDSKNIAVIKSTKAVIAGFALVTMLKN